MPKLLRVAGYVHGQIVLTTIPPVWVFKLMDTITGVINAVTFLQKVDYAVEAQPKCSALY